MTLRRQVVDLLGLHLFQQSVQVAGVGNVTVVEEESLPGKLRIVVDVVDPRGIERTAPPNDAVNLIPLGKQEFGEIRSILTGDAGYKSTL